MTKARCDGDRIIPEPVARKAPRSQAEINAMWARIDARGGADFPDRDQPLEQERDFGW